MQQKAWLWMRNDDKLCNCNNYKYSLSNPANLAQVRQHHSLYVSSSQILEYPFSRTKSSQVPSISLYNFQPVLSPHGQPGQSVSYINVKIGITENGKTEVYAIHQDLNLN